MSSGASWQRVRVVVTGGSGRGGVEVVRAVAASGHEVVNVDRRPPTEELPAGFLLAELDDAGAVYDVLAQVHPEGVCHLAAIPTPAGQARVDVFSNNVLSTYNVLQAASDLGAQRVVYASSEMATGLLTPGAFPSRIPFDESERVASPNAYALSKYLGEVVAESMAVRHPEVAFVGLRLSNIIPPERYDLLEPRRRDPGIAQGNFWSYVDARDVGSAFLAALEGDTTGHEVFLVAAADTCVDRPLRELMAQFYEGYDKVDADAPDHASAFDCSKMERVLGWRPAHSWRDQPRDT